MVTILTMLCEVPVKMVSQTFIMNKSVSKYSHISDPQKIKKILFLTLPKLCMAFMSPSGPHYVALMVVNPELNRICK
jgi:hypothetical protein